MVVVFFFHLCWNFWLKTFSPQWGKLGNDSVLIGAGEWVVRFPNCQKQVGWGTWLVGGFGLGRTMARSKNCSSGCPDPQEGSEWGSTVGLRCSCKQPWSHPPPCTGHYLLLLSLLIHVEPWIDLPPRSGFIQYVLSIIFLELLFNLGFVGFVWICAPGWICVWFCFCFFSRLD